LRETGRRDCNGYGVTMTVYDNTQKQKAWELWKAAYLKGKGGITKDIHVQVAQREFEQYLEQNRDSS